MVKDIPSRATWDALEKDAGAYLIDVRTPEEWQFVGVPDISKLGRRVYTISWQFLGGLINGQFLEELRGAGIDKSQPLYFICRSGARSRSAAIAASGDGFEKVFNVEDGFEGPLNGDMHRGVVSGWKAEGLPWRQN
ncbi:rhodanese-like domain-containing protein [Acetobacter conturbans]|uniref:Rhodanese-like domain-containing protein n=1 Tax=Acetobacter conturbans TaxID=1737472 RepID=A0ABX0K1B7_9PROT|nr:rhodanese-like domain-containing protein [Acetobacter conturbans]NHN87519.1 rhodanese-like domain-containing protein [Acetobacter conturbans]